MELDILIKQKIVDSYLRGENGSKLANFYNISSSTVYRILDM